LPGRVAALAFNPTIQRGGS